MKDYACESKDYISDHFRESDQLESCFLIHSFFRVLCPWRRANVTWKVVVSNWNFTGRPSRSSCVTIDLPWCPRPIAFTFFWSVCIILIKHQCQHIKILTTNASGRSSIPIKVDRCDWWLSCATTAAYRRKMFRPRICWFSGRMLDGACTPAGGSPHSTDTVRRQIWPKRFAVEGRPSSKRYSHLPAIPTPWALFSQTGAWLPFWPTTASGFDNVKCIPRELGSVFRGELAVRTPREFGRSTGLVIFDPSWGCRSRRDSPVSWWRQDTAETSHLPADHGCWKWSVTSWRSPFPRNDPLCSRSSSSDRTSPPPLQMVTSRTGPKHQDQNTSQSLQLALSPSSSKIRSPPHTPRQVFATFSKFLRHNLDWAEVASGSDTLLTPCYKHAVDSRDSVVFILSETK